MAVEAAAEVEMVGGASEAAAWVVAVAVKVGPKVAQVASVAHLPGAPVTVTGTMAAAELEARAGLVAVG